MTTRKYYFQKSNKMWVDIFHVFSSVSACMIQSVFMTGNSDHNLDYCSPPATSPLWAIRRSKKSFTTYFPAVFGRFLKFCFYGDESRTELTWGENLILNVFSSKRNHETVTQYDRQTPVLAHCAVPALWFVWTLNLYDMIKLYIRQGDQANYSVIDHKLIKNWFSKIIPNS